MGPAVTGIRSTVEGQTSLNTSETSPHQSQRADVPPARQHQRFLVGDEQGQTAVTMKWTAGIRPAQTRAISSRRVLQYEYPDASTASRPPAGQTEGNIFNLQTAVRRERGIHADPGTYPSPPAPDTTGEQYKPRHPEGRPAACCQAVETSNGDGIRRSGTT